ncbi:MAG TPA: dienelactone hydrolase family protein, partial [Candidatus Dormibacteraeota bacterium]|nr:dienelactone hydrolase family protein [Candidatus Dormibacteraeota bacterium]
MIELSSGGRQFPVYVARPRKEIRGGLIVIHEVWGLVDHIKSIADRYAYGGYVVVAPDLLSETGITPKLAGQLQEALFDPERRAEAQPKLRELMAPISAPGFAEATTAKVQECYNYLAAQADVTGRIGVTGFC